MLTIRPLCMSVLTCLLAARIASAAAVDIKLGNKGFEIAGSEIGKLVLQYPLLQEDDNKKSVSPNDVKVDGDKVSLAYPNGAKLEIARTEPGVYVLQFSDVPADVKRYRMNLKLPFSMVGKKWAIGDHSGTFPAEYGGKPMLYQGNEKRFSLETPNGNEGFAIIIPFGYQQLQDNREWKSKDFSWFTTSDLPRTGEKEARLTLKLADTSTGNP